MTDEELAAHARDLLGRNAYLVLGTTGPDGDPWTTPVCFAPDGLREFYWVSRTDARHSRHLAGRPRVSIVVFDSTVPPYHGRALYAAGDAAVLADGPDLGRALEVYPGANAPGASRLDRADVTGDEPYRMYRAVADAVWVLCPREPRQACPRHGLAGDHRVEVG